MMQHQGLAAKGALTSCAADLLCDLMTEVLLCSLIVLLRCHQLLLRLIQGFLQLNHLKMDNKHNRQISM